MQYISCVFKKNVQSRNPLEEFDGSLGYSDNTTATVCYRYFVMKKNGIDYETLAKHILQNIIASFDSNSTFYFEVFKDEISEIARILKKHKYLTIYMKKIDRVRENIR